MPWTTELPKKPGFYYRRAVSATCAEADIDLEVGIDIVSIFMREWSHEPSYLCVATFGGEGEVPLSGHVTGFQGKKFQYEFQPVKPPEE